MGVLLGSIIFIIITAIIGCITALIVYRSAGGKKIRHDYILMAFILSALAGFCMWLMWISIYLHQKYPLISPVVKSF